LKEIADVCLQGKRGINESFVPQKSMQAWEAEFVRWLVEHASPLSEIMEKNPNGTAAQIIRKKLAEWTERGQIASAEIELLPESEQYSRRVAYMERLNEDFAHLIEELKALDAR
jgi:hypothetical protein